MMHAVRETLPNIIAYVIMVAIIALPLVMVISGYDLKVLVSVSIIMFGLYFLHYWFELARWLDSRLLEALYDSGGPNSGSGILDFTADPAGDMYMDFTTGLMFLIVPALWMGILGWAGFKGGDFAGKAVESTGKGVGNSQKSGQDKVNPI